jgi:small-conductance mechanosensitive channel
MIRSDIRFRIEQYLNDEGIVIAFPQRDVHLYAKTPIEVVAKDA